MSGCNSWIIKVRDPSKRKNAKPVSVFYWQGDGALAHAMAELFQWNPAADLVALESMAIEARRMTQAEIDKWDREVDRDERRRR